MNVEGEQIETPSILKLLCDWSHIVDSCKFELGFNEHGHRGLLACQPIEAGETVFVLPFSHVLGIAAAQRIMDQEASKGRGMDAEHFMANIIVACQGDDTRIWCCVMSCALLCGLRYPLSAWGPYISSLPHLSGLDTVEQALRRTHALTVRIHMKEAARERNNGSKLSQDVLRHIKQTRDDILAKQRINDELNHVLLWTDEELKRTGDVTLQQLVIQDQGWLEQVWRQLFTDSEEEQPLVSLPSWMWAHAVVRSRAVGLLEQDLDAPRALFDSIGKVNYQGYTLQSAGVLLPVLDMINHDTELHNTKLEVRPDGIALVATAKVDTGDEFLFDYHAHGTLRFFLRSYGFVANTPCRQVFRASRCIELDITANASTSMMQLIKIDYFPSSQRLVFVIDDLSDVDGQLPLHEMMKYQTLACNCCRIVMLDYERSPKDEMNSYSSIETAIEYQKACLQLLQRAYQDLSVVCNFLSDG
eukprot:scaffold144533_cov53-Attheya_sp.AAC.1